MTTPGRSPRWHRAPPGSRRHRPRTLANLVRACLLTVGAWLWLASMAVAASPNPSPEAGGDPRSSGQGPGLVGDPAFALFAVLAIGIGSVLLTLAYVRLTAHRNG